MWQQRFLDLADLVGSWSKDPSTKVGCVLVNSQNIVVGMGYNGFPRGVDDSITRLNDRGIKYLMVQHAELNAVLNAVSDVSGCTAYVTHAPCAACSGVLIQSGVSRIVTNPTPAGLANRFKDSFEASRIMLSEAGVSLEVHTPHLGADKKE